HRLPEVERGAHGPLRVVLLRDGRPATRHNRVAYELLHRAAVALDQAAAGVEVAGQQLAHLLGVARLRERRETDQVGEEHRHQTAFGSGCLSLRRRGGWRLANGRGSVTAQLGTALLAERVA